MASRASRQRKRDRSGAPSPWRLRDDQIESALETGARASELESYFGEARYAELRALAKQAARRDVRGKGPRVLILPGLMGSTLGRRGLLFDDVIWIDPVDIALGALRKLALGPRPRASRPSASLNLVYLKLKLTLRINGFDADFFPYDWRHSPRELGARLARQVAGERRPVQLVAHSLGGLVARAALRSKPAVMKKVGRLVMLGTPNHGSFAAAQALRGTNDLLQKLALFDLQPGSEGAGREGAPHPAEPASAAARGVEVERHRPLRCRGVADAGAPAQAAAPRPGA